MNLSRLPYGGSHSRFAFTLVELLVVIGIISVLVSILLPVLSGIRERAQTVQCMSNLRQTGLAFQMYANASKDMLPYPTTAAPLQTQAEREAVLWFNAIDPFFGATPGRAGATGVAQFRNYNPYKQCPVFATFEGARLSGNQNDQQEFARTYKMNSHLRTNPPVNTARRSLVRRQSEFVLVGDGLSLDITGNLPSVWESGQFSMEVNDITQASPALRHRGGANIAFLDGHVQTIDYLKTIDKRLRSPLDYITVKTWESEYVNSAGQPVNPPNRTASAESQGLSRNPNMPLIWSQLGRLYRP